MSCAKVKISQYCQGKVGKKQNIYLDVQLRAIILTFSCCRYYVVQHSIALARVVFQYSIFINLSTRFIHIVRK